MTAAPSKPAPDAMREALEGARQEIVFAIAFLTRDTSSGRLAATVSALLTRLTDADAAIQTALSAPVPPPDGAAGGILGMLADEREDWRADLHKRAQDRDLERRTIDLKAAQPSSDDVRSALAGELEDIIRDPTVSNVNAGVIMKAVRALRPAPVPAPAMEFDPANFAERIEQTSRLFTVREADSYGSAVRGVRIDCFYDFEANRLIRFLRNVSAPAVGVTREAIELILEKTAREKSGLYLSPVCKSAMADAILASLTGAKP